MKDEEEEKNNFCYQKKFKARKADKKIKVIPTQIKAEELTSSYLPDDFDNRSEQCSGNFDDLLNEQINADCSYAYSIPNIPKPDIKEENDNFDLPIKVTDQRPGKRYNDDNDPEAMWSILSEA